MARELTVAVTMGDPAGVGPELVWGLSEGFKWSGRARCLVVGDAGVLEKAAGVSGRREGDLGDAFELLDLANVPRHEWGVVDAAMGRAAREYIERAVELALSGRVDAVVTCPINKEALVASGSPFHGHTEMLAALTGAGRVGMCLVGGGLRVTLATRHLALVDVPGALTVDAIVEAAELSHEAGDDLGCPSPRIAICGLNPHAGDGGVLGREEIEVIAPAVAEARRRGLSVSGPHVPDAVFIAARRGDYDFVVAMYHDQGLIPLKLLAEGRAVNVTLGLPIVRTSVGHGTAFDIAGKGRADPSSLLAAFDLAVRMAEARRAR